MPNFRDRPWLTFCKIRKMGAIIREREKVSFIIFNFSTEIWDVIQLLILLFSVAGHFPCSHWPQFGVLPSLLFLLNSSTDKDLHLRKHCIFGKDQIANALSVHPRHVH